MIKRFPWHSLFFLLYVVLFLYAENISEVKIADILGPLSYMAIGAAILYSLSWILFKDYKQAAVLTSVIILLFFSYGQYHELLFPQRIPLIGVRFDHNFYKWSSLIIVLWLIWRYKIKNVSAEKMNKLFNFIGIILMFMPLLRIIQFNMQVVAIPMEIHKTKDAGAVPINAKTPSIYYLIADAYGRSDVLENLYSYNNHAFLDYLRNKGFYIADKSFANYAQTVLSLPSALNMKYLDSFARSVGIESDNKWPLKDLLDENEVLQILEQRGYTSVAFDASMFEAVYLDSVDVFIETPGTYINLFEQELLNNTVLRAFHRERFVPKQDSYAHHRKKIINAFETIQEISSKEGPFYVHGHILAPHQPFVFDSSGNAVQPEHPYTIWQPVEDGRNPEEYRLEYISQLKFINQKLMETIDAIIENSEEQPIIILQGDHGPCSDLLNTKGLDHNNFGERMSILNAYYFPDQDYSSVYDSISPVNSYRVVLNQYFGYNLPLLEDRSYFSTWDRPYRFYDVTDSIP